MNYGLLLASLKPLNEESICLVRGLHSTDAVNAIGCPMLKLTDVIFSVASSHIVKSVSVLHECGPSCKFIQKWTERTVEREKLSLCNSKLEYEHDFCHNKDYYINVYCIHSTE